MSPETRWRVLDAAEKLGYRPSVAMSEAMRSARTGGRRQFRETVGCLTAGEPLDRMPPDTGCYYQAQEYLAGFRERSAELGCDMDYISLRGFTGASVRRVLRARGIRRIVMLPYYDAEEQRLVNHLANDFLCVFMGSPAAIERNYFIVSPDYFSAGQTAARAAWGAGYRRFALSRLIPLLDHSSRFEAGFRHTIRGYSPARVSG